MRRYIGLGSIELFARLDAVGAAAPDGYALPLTQEELADVLGLTAVHVNRTLQALRSDGLIQLRDQRLVIADRKALAHAGGFDGSYLHLTSPRGAVQAGGGHPPVPGARLEA